VDPRLAEAENLIRAGALDGLGTIPQLLRQLKNPQERAGQLVLFPIRDQVDLEDWTLAEKVAAQEAVLGVGVIAHPLELAAEKIKITEALTTLEAAAKLGEKVRVAGMRQTWRRSKTQRGDYVYFMALEDLEGMLDTVIFTDVYTRNRYALRDAGPFVIEGEVFLDEELGEPFIKVDKIFRLD
jgi:DNA polymerase III alpha subunit